MEPLTQSLDDAATQGLTQQAALLSQAEEYGFSQGQGSLSHGLAAATQGWPESWAQVDAATEDARLADDLGAVALGAESVAVNDDAGPGPEYEDDEELQGAVELPEHACSYCGIHNPDCVVQCVRTNKWFCNGRIMGKTSCAVQHLVRAKTNEVRLHDSSPLGDCVLECYVTGNKNVFSLGSVPIKSENTVVLLTRNVPASAPEVSSLDLDLSLWEPVIVDRAFVPWLVAAPSDREIVRARRLTVKQIAQLEEVWKSNADACVEDLEAAELEASNLPQVALRYDDAYQYQNTYAPLVKAEADADRALKEGSAREGVTVRWERSEVRKKHLAVFAMPREEHEAHLLVGDELRLKHPDPEGRGSWAAVGVVAHLDNACDQVVLEFNVKDVPTRETNGYDIEFVWKGTSAERMQRAMKSFAVDNTCISSYLYHGLLGAEVEERKLHVKLPPVLSVAGLPELNASQLEAVRGALQQPLSLLQGPPGTGKTVTCATLIYHMCTLSHRQVLVAAPSNVAVDQLAERVDLTGLKVVRLCARAREEVASPCEHLTLHNQVAQIAKEGAYPMLHRLAQLKREMGMLAQEDEKKFKTLQRQAEREILKDADVVCCTCVGAADPRLASLSFKHVLLDEATQATEPESLIGLVQGAKQAVLVGDHCQLGPVVMCQEAARAGLSMSLFERLVLLGRKPFRLAVQYRMHPCLSEFPSNAFYEGVLQNGVSVAERADEKVAFPWPDADKPMMFYVQMGAEEIAATGTSYLNRLEAATAEKVVTHLMKSGVLPGQIGVITPYDGQRTYVMQTMARNGPLPPSLYAAIEVASVDAFQGREKDYIVLTCVRSNELQGIGFLSDPRRLNVALTRAKYGIVILGNPKVLAKQGMWNLLLEHFRSRGCLVEGPLTHLHPSRMRLPASRFAFDPTEFALGGANSRRYRPPGRAGAADKDADDDDKDSEFSYGRMASDAPAAPRVPPPRRAARVPAPAHPYAIAAAPATQDVQDASQAQLTATQDSFGMGGLSQFALGFDGPDAVDTARLPTSQDFGTLTQEYA